MASPRKREEQASLLLRLALHSPFSHTPHPWPVGVSASSRGQALPSLPKAPGTPALSSWGSGSAGAILDNSFSEAQSATGGKVWVGKPAPIFLHFLTPPSLTDTRT